MTEETTKPLIVIHDLATDTVIQREMNDEEYAQLLKDQEAAVKAQEAEAAVQAAKESATAKLAALGLTEDEIAALIK